MSRILYSPDYNTKKRLNDASNTDHYVIVDAGSGAEKEHLDKGWGDKEGQPKTIQEAQQMTAPSVEEADADAVAAAEQKLSEEHAQRVAAEAAAIKTGGVAAQPNDQSTQLPLTETPAAATIKTAVTEQPTPTPVVDAVEAQKAADAEKAKADEKTKAAETAKAAEAAKTSK